MTAAPKRIAWTPMLIGGALALTAGLGQAQTKRPPAVPLDALDTVRCGTVGPRDALGPYDYRNDREALPIVERAHFTRAIENLVKEDGSAGTVDGDLHYTLVKYPNHHRALVAMLRLADKANGRKLGYMKWDFDCYPLRAITFRPDDPLPRMIYALYLARNKRQPEALRQLEATIPLAEDSPLTTFNLGLAFFDSGDMGRALTMAHRAMAMGVTSTALKDRLVKAGHWAEPAGESPSAPAASAPASAVPADVEASSAAR